MGFQISFWGFVALLALTFALVGLGMAIERGKNNAAWDKFYEGLETAEKNRRARWDKYPCKDCPKRHPGCQDHCEDFKAAKAVNEARKEKERKARNLQHELNGFAMRQASVTAGKKLPQR